MYKPLGLAYAIVLVLWVPIPSHRVQRINVSEGRNPVECVHCGGAGTLARVGFTPQWALLPQFHGPELCRDTEGARNYDDDPLNYHGKLKVRIALQTMQAMQMNRLHFTEYTLPILCMHGTKDVTTSLSAAEVFVQVRGRCLTVGQAIALLPALTLCQLPL